MFKVGDRVRGPFGERIITAVLERGVEVKAPSSIGQGVSLWVVLASSVAKL